MFHPKRTGVVLRVNKGDGRVFNKFVVKGVVSSLVVKMVYFVKLSVLGVPCAVLIDIVMKIAGMVPFFKPCVKTVPDTVLVLLTSPLGKLCFVVFIVTLRRFSKGILKPGVLKGSAKLSSF